MVLCTSIPVIDEEMRNAVLRVFDEEQMLVGGEEVQKLEKEFASYIGVKHCVALSSGTDALVMAQKIVCTNGEVVTSSVSFVATPESVVLAGGTPVFVDINRRTWNMDTGFLRKAISDKTKALLPVHLYGLPMDMKMLRDVADEHGLYLIEDACQAHGASVNGQKVGGIGDVGCFSLYATKNMTCGGNGGLLTTNDDDIADVSVKLREHGRSLRMGANYSNMVGWNARMNTVQAAIARVQLKHLDEWNKYRGKLADLYYEGLQGISSRLMLLPVRDQGRVYHLFVIRSSGRDVLQDKLRSQGIFCGVHYPQALTQLDPYKKHGVGYTEAEMHCSQCLSLPLHPGVSFDQVQWVCEIIGKHHGVV